MISIIPATNPESGRAGGSARESGRAGGSARLGGTGFGPVLDPAWHSWQCAGPPSGRIFSFLFTTLAVLTFVSIYHLTKQFVGFFLPQFHKHTHADFHQSGTIFFAVRSSVVISLIFFNFL